MNAQGELINTGTLVSIVEDADLGVRHTAAKARLDVRLVLAIARAARRSTSLRK